jgi:hypothetical protein
MERDVPDLFTLAGNLEMRHAAAHVPEVLDFEGAELVAAQGVKEQGRQDRAIALALDGVFIRSGEQ